MTTFIKGIAGLTTGLTLNLSTTRHCFLHGRMLPCKECCRVQSIECVVNAAAQRKHLSDEVVTAKHNADSTHTVTKSTRVSRLTYGAN